MQRVPYASGIDSLMYGMVCTRSDLAFTVSIISRFMSNPDRVHLEALKWTLRYIKGSSDIGLVFKSSKEEADKLIGYVDAYFAGSLWLATFSDCVGQQ